MLDIQDPVEARKVIRENKYTEQTAGSANKYVQGNLCILPSKYAMDFASFCQKNPKPCPLIGFGTKGDPSLKDLGDIDIRTDVPQYRVWEKGKLVEVSALGKVKTIIQMSGISLVVGAPLVKDSTLLIWRYFHEFSLIVLLIGATIGVISAFKYLKESYSFLR